MAATRMPADVGFEMKLKTNFELNYAPDVPPSSQITPTPIEMRFDKPYEKNTSR